MALPPPPLRSPQKKVFTRAAFSSQHTYVRKLNLWHIKTEKQLQVKTMVAKRPSQIQVQKHKLFFQQKAQVNADNASSLYLNHLRQRAYRR